MIENNLMKIFIYLDKYRKPRFFCTQMRVRLKK